MAVMPAQLPVRMSAAGQSQEPPTATHIRLGQPGRRIGLPDAAGRAQPHVRKRPRQRAQCLDTAGLLGREEFDEIKALRQRLHQFGGRRDPRCERQVARGGGFQEFRRRARADAELGAERLGAREIVGVQDRADADDGFRHLGDHGLGGLDATGVRSVTSSMRTPPATSASASGTASSSRSMVSTGMTWPDLNRRRVFPALQLRSWGGLARIGEVRTSPRGIAARGMMAPGWHTTTPARRCPARAASTGVGARQGARRHRRPQNCRRPPWYRPRALPPARP